MRIQQDRFLTKLKKQSGQQLTKRILEITALYNLSRACNLTISLEDIVGEADKFLKKFLGVDDYSIMLLDDSGKELRLLKTKTKIYSPGRGMSLRLSEGISGMAVRRRRAIVVDDVQKDKRFLHYKGKKLGTGSFLSLPLKVSSRTIVGVLNIHKPLPRSFAKQDLVFYGAAATHIAGAVNKAQKLKTAEMLSISDQLTGLFSRRYFLNEVDRLVGLSERKQSKFAVIILDIDHFKAVNDDLGHQEGDKVLSAIGALINANIRKGDVAARYGGEEIIILVADATLEFGKLLAGKLLERTASEITAGKGAKARRVTLSGGVSAFPTNGKTTTELIAAADQALYMSKNSGRNRVSGPVEEENPVPGDRRKGQRFSVALRRIYSDAGIGRIDLYKDAERVPCIIYDVSSSGLKGLLNYRPVLGETLMCRVHTIKNPEAPIEFPISCRVSTDLGGQFYAIGAEVLENTENWVRCLEKMGV